MSFFVTADGGLTTAGYVGCVVLMVALVVIASVLSAQKSKGTGTVSYTHLTLPTNSLV